MADVWHLIPVTVITEAGCLFATKRANILED